MKRRILAVLLLAGMVSAPMGAAKQPVGRVLASEPGRILEDVARIVYELVAAAAELVLPTERKVVLPSSSEGETDPTSPPDEATLPPATQETHPQIDPWG